MAQGYESIHTDLFHILTRFDENYKDKYFKLFYIFIVSNTFNHEYIFELSNSNFLETIKNQTEDSSIIDLINEVNNIVKKQTNKCNNCQSEIEDYSICMTCGFESEDYSICIEKSFENKYSHPYQRINIHNPNKYYETWILQLQGKEMVKISSENFNKILNLAKIWFCSNTELSCDIIRKWLKSLTLSRYNSHITWLRKEIESACGIKSYSFELTNNEINKILEHLKEIIEFYPKIKRKSAVLKLFKRGKIQNHLYYPFFIVRILSHVIPDKNRLTILLSNIHFQSKSILVRNEYIWKEICKQLRYEYLPLEKIN